MNFRDIFLAPGKKQTNIEAYSAEHRAVVKELARRDIKW